MIPFVDTLPRSYLRKNMPERNWKQLNAVIDIKCQQYASLDLQMLSNKCLHVQMTEDVQELLLQQFCQLY
jgi:hypothetical protein